MDTAGRYDAVREEKVGGAPAKLPCSSAATASALRNRPHKSTPRARAAKTLSLLLLRIISLFARADLGIRLASLRCGFSSHRSGR
jgi:hypothetical protein